ncbi:hypothetical protein [Chitinimonas koreensis]|uniref:hypothetical protein n=1 Tax=Chitinimonas koreensis TaxID=356302 RepID=UPI0003FD1C56|nr:hypothetical protein [Chitinimonas koreensis]QNM97154.1 prepilin-type cleavage/methylation domain-containing protein [Chitinimonas koreensis]
MRIRHASGFTLTEAAIVLVVVGLLLGGLMTTLPQQIAQRRADLTRSRLELAREALLGFAVSQGRLPCPATASSHGDEVPGGGGHCAGNDGLLPGRTLGLDRLDAEAHYTDGWDRPIRYALASDHGSHRFSTAEGMRQAGLGMPFTGLRVCSDLACSDIQGKGLVAVLLSTGAEGPGANGIDEAANLDGDADFVAHEPRETAGNRFDDQLVWLPPVILYNRMVMAGQLP